MSTVLVQLKNSKWDFGKKDTVADRGGRGATPLVLYKLAIKKMAAEGGRIDLMFLAPRYPAAGSATETLASNALLQTALSQNIAESTINYYLYLFYDYISFHP